MTPVDPAQSEPLTDEARDNRLHFRWSQRGMGKRGYLLIFPDGQRGATATERALIEELNRRPMRSEERRDLVDETIALTRQGLDDYSIRARVLSESEADEEPVAPPPSEALTDTAGIERASAQLLAAGPWDHSGSAYREIVEAVLDTCRPAPSEALEGLIEKLEARADEWAGKGRANAVVDGPMVAAWEYAYRAEEARSCAQMARDALAEGTRGDG